MPTLLCNSTFAQTPPIEPGVSQTLAKWRAANYSDVRYKLNIKLEKGAPLMKGDIEIHVKFSNTKIVQPQEADSELIGGSDFKFVLDWRKIKGKEDSYSIKKIMLNGKRAEFEEINEHLVIKNAVNGENIIKLEFTSPISTSGTAVTRYVDREDGSEYIYSLFVPSDASTAFPCFDQPDLKAKFSLTIISPSFKTVVSNSKEIFPTVTSIYFPNYSHTFAETKPISTYVFAFAAGDFAEVSEPSAVADGLTSPTRNILPKSKVSAGKLQPPATAGGSDLAMRIYVRQSQAEKFKQHAAEVFRLNREGVRFLESWFDYKFPFPKYDLVLLPEFPFGGMEHAGATFLREDRVIFPTEPTKNDYITRANVIFHEAAHQWFGDTVTMKWFDDLWLKEGFAEFMAYKTLAKVMPEYNAWKIFYERNKQAAYLTDSTRGTTPIYQEILNLSAAKSAYGNIVYRKAPSFLRQAEFYLGEDKFQIAVRAFLKKHEFANAEWTDLVKEFELASNQDLKDWANVWVKQRGTPIIKTQGCGIKTMECKTMDFYAVLYNLNQKGSIAETDNWQQSINILIADSNGRRTVNKTKLGDYDDYSKNKNTTYFNAYQDYKLPQFIFPNYGDYGYGIFLLDEKSRAYVLANIQTEKDDFLRTMMWGALWDSVRETELAPQDYVELVIKNINVESDESTIQTLLGRVSTAMNYYIKSEPSALAGGLTSGGKNSKSKVNPPADADGSDLAARLETLLIDKLQNAPTLGQRITFNRAFLNIASSEKARTLLKDTLSGKTQIEGLKLKTKDKFDIVTRLLILNDKDAPQLLAELEKTETSDEAKRYAFAAKAGIATAENKAKFWNDFVNNKDLSESFIESAFVPFNSTKHTDLTLPYLEKALAELPNLKRTRKIFFVNGWLAAFIGGQKSETALKIVNKFLADNPNLDKDLRLKILENSDNLERSVKIRAKFGN